MSFTGPDDALQLFGITLIGVTPENGRKLLLTAVIILIIVIISRLLHALVGRAAQDVSRLRTRFWIRQAANILIALVAVMALVSIWFDDPARLTTAIGLVTAGLAFALQRVITAIAGYLVILRGRTFNVGDRIVMGGVRGDVIALDFMQTTIMEMGQPPAVQNADPAMWVKARQYTGRIVTVTNAKIFDEPIYNYTRDFSFLFEEITTPIKYDANRARAEAILLEVARRYTIPLVRMKEAEKKELQRRYFMQNPEFEPRVYWRMTDNWLELTVRFVAQDHGVRELKDAMTRDILVAYEQAGIGIASATFEVVGVPALTLRLPADRM
ncbi:mechanosensitive ion channel family protein [Microvirga arabica]|uniref:mechanosensitive ion channel family protein n=1 Tax=Microvirga arabica TaxID=1128671 RepID=UPI0028B0FB8F|nr:mechanosensitive ion channel family protein [Microvirga arabica]